MGPRPPIAVAPLFWREEGLNHCEVSWLPRWDKVWRLLWFFCLYLWAVPCCHESPTPPWSLHVTFSRTWPECSTSEASPVQSFWNSLSKHLTDGDLLSLLFYLPIWLLPLERLIVLSVLILPNNRVSSVMTFSIIWLLFGVKCLLNSDGQADFVLSTGSMVFPWCLKVSEVHAVTPNLPLSSTFSKRCSPSTQSMNTAPHLHIVLVIQTHLGGLQWLLFLIRTQVWFCVITATFVATQ